MRMSIAESHALENVFPHGSAAVDEIELLITDFPERKSDLLQSLSFSPRVCRTNTLVGTHLARPQFYAAHWAENKLVIVDAVATDAVHGLPRAGYDRAAASELSVYSIRDGAQIRSARRRECVPCRAYLVYGKLEDVLKGRFDSAGAHAAADNLVH